MTEPLIKLKPCPFCGNTVRLELFETLLLPYYAICDKCGALGPNDLGESGACDAWNTRPIEAQLLEAFEAIADDLKDYLDEWADVESPYLPEKLIPIKRAYDAAISAAEGAP